MIQMGGGVAPGSVLEFVPLVEIVDIPINYLKYTFPTFYRSAQGDPDPPNVIDVGKTIFLCMSGKLAEAVYQLQYNVTAAINVNNCW